ncbi:MAG: hypothetical protein ACRDSR_01335, partial [Pseudonocardiaceae bacterium]
LRFLYPHGHTPALLVDAVPVAPSWRDQGVVRAMPVEDVARMLAAASRRPRPLSAATYHTLFGLLAVTGMRVGEAVGLNIDMTAEFMACSGPHHLSAPGKPSDQRTFFRVPPN